MTVHGKARHRPALLMTASALALPAAALAQEPPPVGEPAQATIVVTGRGLADTPATPAYDVQEVTRETLTSAPSGRIEDALASVAGFQQFRRSDSRSSNPSAQGATLRALGGNASSRAQVLLDGVPMTDPFFGYIPFSAIAPERLSSARVTRGGGSGPFGAGALAGTIELTSADAATLGLMSGSALINDRGETEASATVAPKLGSGFAIVSARWDRGKGFWITPVDQRVAASARARYDSWSVQGRAVAPIGHNVELQARVLAYHDERTLRFKGADTGMEGQDASLRLVGRGAWQFDVLGYVQARNFNNIVVSSRSFNPTLDQRNTPATGLGGKFELRPPVGDDHVLRIGADYRKSDGDMYETALNATTGVVTARRHAGGTNTDLGFFLEDDWSIGALTLTAGGRADRYTIRDGFFTEVTSAGAATNNRYANRAGWEGSFRGGAVYRLGDVVQLRAAGYTGLRLPTLNELYRPFTVFPVVTRANAALRNEKLEGFEAGIDLTPATAVRLSLTAFDNRVKHAVANVTIGTNLRERQNIASIKSRGIEASGGLTLGDFSFEGSAAYTTARAHQAGAAFDRLRPAQTPKWAGSATASYRPAQDWLLSATVRHVGKQYEDDLQSDALRAATTLDAYAHIPVKGRFAIVMRAENLTDTKVVTRNQGGSMDLGTPRTVWAGLSFGM